VPRVSVITPLYNGEMFLPYTIQSVLAQSFRDFELLLVDDGSKDGSLAIAKEYAQKDSRIKVSSQTNMGVGATRHRAAAELACAGSEFLLFLDQDDILEVDALRQLVELANSQPQSVAAHGFLRIIDGKGESVPYHHCEIHNWMRRKIVDGAITPTPISEPTNFHTLSYLNFIYSPGCVLMRKTAYTKSGGFDQKFAPADDWDLWLKLVRIGPMAALPQTVLAWRLHGQNHTFDREKMLAATDAVYEQHIRDDNPENAANMRSGYLQFTRDRIQEGGEKPEVMSRLKEREITLQKETASHFSGSKTTPNKRRKLRVLLAIHYMGLTGAPRVILDLFEHLEASVEIRIIYLEGGLLEKRAWEMTDCRNLSVLTNAGGGIKSKIKRKLRKALWERWVRKFDPDIIYVNTAAALPALDVLNLPKKPLVLHVHEMRMMLEKHFAPYRAGFDNWPGRKEVICVSEACRADMALVGKLEPQKINVINACVPLNFAIRVAKQQDDAKRVKRTKEMKRALRQVTDPTQIESAITEVLARQKVVKKEGPFVVGGSGVTQWQKGLEPWLLVASRVSRRMPRGAVKFQWIGMDYTPDTPEVLAKVKLLGLEDIVEFVPQTMDPFSYYAQFDIFAMTSWEDPCPLVVLETMLLEKPVVCFKNGMGASEEVADTGIVIPSGLPSDMADAIESLLHDENRRTELGKAASKRVLMKFSVNKSARELAGLLQDMARGSD